MHRTRTRFAARVNRVAAGFERRGVVATYEVHDRLLANRGSRRRYAQEPVALDEVQRGVVERLRQEGYASLPFSDLVPDTNVWQELEADATRFVAETETGLASEQEGGESALRRRAGKEFRISASGATFETASFKAFSGSSERSVTGEWIIATKIENSVELPKKENLAGDRGHRRGTSLEDAPSYLVAVFGK